MSMYGFNHDFLLNWMTLSTFFDIKSWFNACLKLLCEQHSFLSYRLGTSLLDLLILILFGKNGKLLWIF